MAITFNHNDKLYVSGSNVGIGTDSPTSILHLENAGNTWAKFINTSGTNQRLDVGTNSSSQHFVFGYGAYPVLFGSNGAERMRIASDGNVGIGTTSPNVPLEIQGADIITTSTTTATSVLRLVRDITDASFPNRKNSAVDFMLSRQQTVNNNLPYTRLDIRLAGTTDSSTPSLDVMSLLHNGNVGIGKTDPSAPLHINGGSTNQVVKIQSNSAPYIRFKEGGTDVGFIQFGTDTYISNQKDGTLNFRTNNTDKMTILSNGNVGIGTTNPTRDLHIVKSNDGGQVRFQIINTSNTADSTSVISIYNGGADGGDPFLHWKIDAQQDWSMGIDNSDADKLKISKNFGPGTNDYLTVDTSGNVGIGTTGPASVLHIKNSVPEIVLEDSDVANRKGKVLANNGNLGLFADSDNVQSDSIIYFNIDSSEKMRIDSDGNVGIGTTNPSEKLTVNGKILLENSGTPIFTIKDTGNSGGGGASGMIRFKNNSGDAIGIGYTSNDTSTSDLLISTNAASTYGGYLGLDAIAITDPSSIILDPKTSVIINGDAVIGEHRIIDLPSFNMGASSVTDEYLVVCKQAPSGGGVDASGIQGRISFSRGSDGSFNNSQYIDINIQMSLDSGSVNNLDVTQFELYRDSSNPFFSQLEEIDIDGTKYVALKARSSGGGSVNHFYFEGSISDASDTNILSRVRASDSTVTVTDPQPTGFPITPYITKNQDGNLGIGTTSPTFTLDVPNGNARFNDIRLNDGRSLSSTSGGTGYVVLSPNNGDVLLNTATNSNNITLQLGAGNPILTVKSNNVGIGNTSPSQKLHVAGNIKATGWIGRDSSNYITFDETNNYIDFYAGGNWVARLESDGDLHVKGDVIAFSDIFNP